MKQIIIIVVAIMIIFYAGIKAEEFLSQIQCIGSGSYLNESTNCSITNQEQSSGINSKPLYFENKLSYFRRKMVSKSKKLCRKITRRLLQQHSDGLFIQIATSYNLNEYLSVSSGKKSVLIHLVPSDDK